MPFPVPNPEPPPAEPPFGLWTSVGILAVGVALAAYLVVAMWRRSGKSDSEREESEEQSAETPESGTSETEHPDPDVV